MRVWALTGPEPNPLVGRCHQVLAVPSPDPQVVQELHLVAVHVLCEYVDLTLPTVLGVANAYAGPSLAGNGHGDIRHGFTAFLAIHPPDVLTAAAAAERARSAWLGSPPDSGGGEASSGSTTLASVPDRR